jgi:hypothetical protein
LIYCVVENWIASDSGGHSVRKLTGIIYFPKISANFTCVIKNPTSFQFTMLKGPNIISVYNVKGEIIVR